MSDNRYGNTLACTMQPMRRGLLLIAPLLGCTLNVVAGRNHSYLFAWCGDIDKTASDFLAVIDADHGNACAHGTVFSG